MASKKTPGSNTKLVTLPSEVWKSLKEQGYYIPYKDHVEPTKSTRTDFKVYVRSLTDNQREALFIEMLQPFMKVTAHNVGLLHASICQNEFKELELICSFLERITNKVDNYEKQNNISTEVESSIDKVVKE